MSTYDMLIEKGIEKGIEKINTEVVLRCFDNQYDLKTIALIAGLEEKEVKKIIKTHRGV